VEHVVNNVYKSAGVGYGQPGRHRGGHGRVAGRGRRQITHADQYRYVTAPGPRRHLRRTAPRSQFPAVGEPITQVDVAATLTAPPSP